LLKTFFGVPIGAFLLTFAPAASAASYPVKVANRSGADAASFESGLTKLAQWALVLGGFGLTGAVLRAQKPRNNLS